MDLTRRDCLSQNGQRALTMKSNAVLQSFAASVERDFSASPVGRLHHAAYHGDKAELRALTEGTLDDDAINVNTLNPKNGRNVIHSAVLGFPQKGILFYLVKTLGAEADLRDGRGLSPLLYAARMGHTRSISQLMALQCDEHVVDKKGLTAMHYAAQHGHLVCCVWLYQAGLPATKAADDGRQPIHLVRFPCNDW